MEPVRRERPLRAVPSVVALSPRRADTGPMRVVERDDILAALHACVQDCQDGEGRLVLVSGEAGVGKTTVLEQLRAGRPRLRWLHSGCDDLSTPRPLSALFDLAAQAGGALEAACRRGAAREELFGALVATLVAEQSHEPTVLAIEDIHWADESTLDLVRFLGRRAGELGIVILVTYRADEVGTNDRLRVVLGDLTRERATRRISVPVLSRAAVELLAEGTSLAPDELYRLTGGNSFFVTEIVQAGTADVPPSARDVVLARMARLSDEARAVVQSAALIGTSIDPRLLQQVAEPTLDLLDEVMASGVLVSDPDALRFRHEITRMSVAGDIPLHRRAPIHARILAALQADGCEDDARLAHHAEGAGDRAAVLRCASRAAKRASQLASHRESAAQYRRALRFASGEPDEFVADLYDGLAIESSLNDRWPEAADAEERALALWHGLGDVLRQGDVLRRRSRTMWRLGRGHEALECANQAIALLRTCDDSVELAWAWGARAAMDMMSGRVAAGLEAAVRAETLARQFAVTDLLSDVLNTRACLLVESEQLWEPPLTEALTIAIDNGHGEQAGRAYANFAEIYVEAMRLDDADTTIECGLAYSYAHDVSTYYNCLRGARVAVLTARGCWDDALAVGRSMLSIPASPVNRLIPLVHLGRILARRDDPSAWELLDEARAIAIGTDEPDRLAFTGLARAEAYWLAGRQAEAAAELEALTDVIDISGSFERGAYVQLVRRVGAQLRLPSKAVAEPHRLVLAGEFEAAAAAWTNLGCPLEAADALLDSGTDDGVREALRRYDALGARAAVRATRREMRRLGFKSVPVGARSATRANPMGLTRREVEVLGLIRAGRTNGEIAEHMVISTRTVDHHVSAVLAKLGVTTRGNAAAKAERLGLTSTRESGVGT